MATGNTNAKYVVVYVDDSGGTARDISCSVSDISGVGLEYETTDVTAFCDGVRNFTTGHATSEITITGPFDNSATTGGHTVFSGITGVMTNTITVTVQVGIRAAPTTGDPEFEGEYYNSSYMVNFGDGTYTAVMVPASGTAPAWGTVA